jgi:hypothetical protein
MIFIFWLNKKKSEIPFFELKMDQVWHIFHFQYFAKKNNDIHRSEENFDLWLYILLNLHF